MEHKLILLQKEYLANRADLQKKNEFLTHLMRYLHKVVVTQHTKLSTLQINEIIQDTLLNVLQYLDRIENIIAYAYRVISQSYANAMKKLKTEILVDYEKCSSDESADEFYELFKRLDEELESRLWAIIDELKPPHDVIMKARYKSGLKYREIGHKLDLPTGHINAMMQRSLKLFIKTLKNEYSELYSKLAVYFKKQD